MEKCKLKKGGRIYECRCHEATLTELIENPKLRVQGGRILFTGIGKVE